MNTDAQKRALESELAMQLYSHLRKHRPRAFSLGELSAEFKVDAARIHYRLSELVDVDLVEIRWRGTTVTYALAPDQSDPTNGGASK